MESVKIVDIVINERFRKSVGSLSALVQSIKEVGLLHPIVVSEKNELIAGLRRIKAFESLGRIDIPCTRINLADLCKGEIQENLVRKDFTASEILAIDEATSPKVEGEAKERQGTRTDLGKKLSPKLGRSSDVIASYAGISHGTLDKLRSIGKAAKKEPENHGRVVPTTQ